MLPGIEEKEAERLSESLDETAEQVRGLQEVLRDTEVRFLGGVAGTFLKAVERLLEVVERLRKLQEDEWLTAEEAARYVKAKNKETFEKIPDVPKHYLTPRVPRYHREELREWLRSK